MNQPPSQVDTKVNRRHEIKEVQEKSRTVKKKGRVGESKRELRRKTKSVIQKYREKGETYKVRRGFPFLFYD